MCGHVHVKYLRHSKPSCLQAGGFNDNWLKLFAYWHLLESVNMHIVPSAVQHNPACTTTSEHMCYSAEQSKEAKLRPAGCSGFIALATVCLKRYGKFLVTCRLKYHQCRNPCLHARRHACARSNPRDGHEPMMFLSGPRSLRSCLLCRNLECMLAVTLV